MREAGVKRWALEAGVRLLLDDLLLLLLLGQLAAQLALPVVEWLGRGSPLAVRAGLVVPGRIPLPGGDVVAVLADLDHLGLGQAGGGGGLGDLVRGFALAGQFVLAGSSCNRQCLGVGEARRGVERRTVAAPVVTGFLLLDALLEHAAALLALLAVVLGHVPLVEPLAV